MTKKQSIKRVAYLLIATGVLHNLIGFGLGFQVLAEMMQEGLFNSTEGAFDRQALFWFLFSGFAMMLWGTLIMQLESIPKVFSWSLLALSVLGVFIIPISGFWLVILQAIYMLWLERSGVRTSALQA